MAAARAFTNLGSTVSKVDGIADGLVSSIMSAVSDPGFMKTLIKAQPDAFIPIFKQMEDVDLKAIYKSLDADGKAKLARAMGNTDNLALLKRMVPDSSVIKTTLAIGAGAGLLAWLDDKFEDSEEELDYGTAFNCVELPLTRSDIDELEYAINNFEFPEANGFFWGSDSYFWNDEDGKPFPENEYYYKEQDLNFISEARKMLDKGYRIYYTCWY